MKKLVLIIMVFIISLSFSSCSKEVNKYEDSQIMLDTFITIKAYGENSEKAVNKAFSEIKRIEDTFSAYIKTSEISKINENAYKNGYQTTDEVISVLKEALYISKVSNGAFDITVKPLMDIWDFKSENPKVPTDEELNFIKDAIGYKNIEIKGNEVYFKHKDTKIDLGGACKGYAADKAVEVLKSYGITDALLDLGGNIYTLGKNEKGEKWKIGLQDPSKDRGEHFKVLSLSDTSCVTSGSYERYFEIDGKVYHHIIDPHTLKSANSGLVSVSVVGKSSFLCDMLSTTAFVMGKDEFLKIKDKFGIQSIVFVDNKNIKSAY